MTAHISYQPPKVHLFLPESILAEGQGAEVREIPGDEALPAALFLRGHDKE